LINSTIGIYIEIYNKLLMTYYIFTYNYYTVHTVGAQRYT
jgi:hypothetical protein